MNKHNGSPPHGYKGGSEYENIPRGDGQKLPEGVKYKEYDVNPHIKGKRDKERIVIGNDGSIWYTNNHYTTFIKVTGKLFNDILKGILKWIGIIK